MSKKVTIMWLLIPVMLLFSGCMRSSLTTEQLQNIKKVAIWVSPKGRNPFILNHTGISETWNSWRPDYDTSTEEGLNSWISDSIRDFADKMAFLERKKWSLGGDPYPLMDSVKDFSVREHLSKELNSRIGKRYPVFEATGCVEEFRGLITYYDMSLRKTGPDCIKSLAADTLLQIHYHLGVAVYDAERSSVAIDAELWISNINTKKCLMKKKISSDEYFQEGHTVDEFAENDAMLFKKHAMKAAEAIALIAAKELHIDLEESPDSKMMQEVQTSILREDRFADMDDLNWLGNTKRNVSIDGHIFGVAGTPDGKAIYIQKGVGWDILVKKRKREGGVAIITEGDCYDIVYRGLEAVKSKLAEHRINIVNKYRVMWGNHFKGYLIELDGEGYSIIKQYTIE